MGVARANNKENGRFEKLRKLFIDASLIISFCACVVVFWCYHFCEVPP